MRKKPPSAEERLEVVQERIRKTMFIPDYVSVVMEHKNHYKHMYKYGFDVNGKHYVRASCSAGQARVSTVIFVCE